MRKTSLIDISTGIYRIHVKVLKDRLFDTGQDREEIFFKELGYFMKKIYHAEPVTIRIGDWFCEPTRQWDDWNRQVFLAYHNPDVAHVGDKVTEDNFQFITGPDPVLFSTIHWMVNGFMHKFKLYNDVLHIQRMKSEMRYWVRIE